MTADIFHPFSRSLWRCHLKAENFELIEMGLRAEDFSPALNQFQVIKGGKFCEMTADVFLGRGAYIEVCNPTDVKHHLRVSSQ